jgi:hypothetical protein
MCLGTAAAVRLKCALRHGTAILNSFVEILPARCVENHLHGAKHKYIPYLQKPQKTHSRPTFSQRMVQLSRYHKIPEETTFAQPLDRASIGSDYEEFLDALR